MELIIETTDGKKEKFVHTWKYQTNEQGELDILSDEDFPVATFAKGQWKYVRRLKEFDEQWPVAEPERTDEERPEILDGIPDFLTKGKPRPGESRT